VESGDHPDRNDDERAEIGDGGALLAQRDEKRCPEQGCDPPPGRMSGTAA